jgi:hypothetical protein
MDDRKIPISPNAPRGRTDADAASVDPVQEASSIIYFCSAEEVSEGFAIALRTMGFETEIRLSDIIPQSGTASNRKER